MELEANAVYTLQEAAKLLKVHERTLWREVRAGRVPAFRVGRQWRLYGHDLLALTAKESKKARKGAMKSALASSGD